MLLVLLLVLLLALLNPLWRIPLLTLRKIILIILIELVLILFKGWLVNRSINSGLIRYLIWVLNSIIVLIIKWIKLLVVVSLLPELFLKLLFLIVFLNSLFFLLFKTFKKGVRNTSNGNNQQYRQYSFHLWEKVNEKDKLFCNRENLFP